MLNYQNFNQLNFLNRIPWPLIIIVALWTLYWKWKALWAASHNNQKYWFTALLLINGLGILEIVYLQFFQKHSSKK